MPCIYNKPWPPARVFARSARHRIETRRFAPLRTRCCAPPSRSVTRFARIKSTARVCVSRKLTDLLCTLYIIQMSWSKVYCAYCKVQVTVVMVVTMRMRVYRTPVSWTEISWKKKSWRLCSLSYHRTNSSPSDISLKIWCCLVRSEVLPVGMSLLEPMKLLSAIYLGL